VRIGALAPLSPPGWADAGRQLLAGMELAARERDIELIVRDTAADPARAVAAIDELAGLGVPAVAGEFHSVVARAAAMRAHEIGLPFLCSSAVMDALTDGPTDVVARLSPPQSRGWSAYAEHLLAAGHQRVAVAAQESAYWAAGTQILAARFDVRRIDPDAVSDELAASGATAVVVLAGYPEPTTSIVASVRSDPRHAGVLVGTPAGQADLAGWPGIPSLRYLPERLTPLGERVAEALGPAGSFVALEGYDAIAILAEGTAWRDVAVVGTRGEIRFSRVPGIGVWQWADAPIEVATG
jgi:ABC-type branched-subunit amino acid transport system substrate-binding protein